MARALDIPEMAVLSSVYVVCICDLLLHNEVLRAITGSVACLLLSQDEPVDY
jgi:hypothetical protein